MAWEWVNLMIINMNVDYKLHLKTYMFFSEDTHTHTHTKNILDTLK